MKYRVTYEDGWYQDIVAQKWQREDGFFLFGSEDAGPDIAINQSYVRSVVCTDTADSTEGLHAMEYQEV